jgi:hypothetical protein
MAQVVRELWRSGGLQPSLSLERSRHYFLFANQPSRANSDASL